MVSRQSLAKGACCLVAILVSAAIGFMSGAHYIDPHWRLPWLPRPPITRTPVHIRAGDEFFGEYFLHSIEPTEVGSPSIYKVTISPLNAPHRWQTHLIVGDEQTHVSGPGTDFLLKSHGLFEVIVDADDQSVAEHFSPPAKANREPR